MSLIFEIAFELVAESLWRKWRGRDDVSGADDAPYVQLTSSVVSVLDFI